jgi:hypothetical protein
MASTILAPDVEANAGNVELKENTVIVVLGASGDLAKKKTVSFVHSTALSKASANKLCTVPRSLWPCELLQHTSLPQTPLTTCQVPKQLPAQGHPDRGLCADEDGP